MKLAKSLKDHYRAILSGIGLAILVVLIQVLVQRSPNSQLALQINRIDGFIYDLRLKATIGNRKSGFADIVIVDLDERTMDAIGWPWPRAKLADMVYNLADAGAVVVVFDIIFADRERNPAAEVNAVLREQNIDSENIAALIDSMDGDKMFMESFSATDVMFSYILHQDDIKRGILPSHEIVSDDLIDHRIGITKYIGYESSLPMFHEASVGEGFMNSSPDADGFLRRSSLVLRYGDKLFPSLSLEAARLYALADEIKVKTKSAGALINVEGLMIGNQLIPTDAEGRVLIPYRGPRKSFPYVSAIDVLNNKFDADLFDSSIVMVGTSAIGLADLRSTPVGVQYPGVEVHANVVEGLLDPSILKYRPDWWEALVTIYLIIIGLLLAITMPLLGPVGMALCGTLAMGGTVYANVWLWNNANIALPMTSSILLVLFLMVYNIGTGFFAENKRRQQIKGIFDQYVPPAHIDKMLEEPDSVTMEGERKELSVLFSDIRSFTTISETLTANELKVMLNRYFDPITECIFYHQGTIDKYVGDMVMAFWGAPLDDPKHAQNSVETAFEMLRITARLREEFKVDGLPEVRVGIGINTGDMNVGDMGSTFRKAYTVLGDAVNLGSRLEGLTKYYGVELLVSQATIDQCEGVVYRRIDKVKVKGKNEAVAIVQPIAPEDATEAYQTEMAAYHKAYDYYLTQQWQEATEAFNKLATGHPSDILYTLYLERIESLKEQDLPPDWDGSYTHTSK